MEKVDICKRWRTVALHWNPGKTKVSFTSVMVRPSLQVCTSTREQGTSGEREKERLFHGRLRRRLVSVMSGFYGLVEGRGQEETKIKYAYIHNTKKEHGNTACRIPYTSTRVITILCSETRSYNARERLSVSGGWGRSRCTGS